MQQNNSAHFSRKFCGSPVAQASACVVLICVGAEKSTQTEVCATRGALALGLNSTQRVAIPEHPPRDECEKSGLIRISQADSGISRRRAWRRTSCAISWRRL